MQDGTQTPYEYVEAVENYLGNDFAYSERPPASARTLDGFLFDAKIGFCQQFSGAEALLLRMGGVPARVATGFSPGGFSKRKQAWIVRDTDAHSWVEAWFDQTGWVTYDPTPAAAKHRCGRVGRSQSASASRVASSPLAAVMKTTIASSSAIGTTLPLDLRLQSCHR